MIVISIEAPPHLDAAEARETPKCNMDKETYQALKRVIDRIQVPADMEDDDIERVAGWIEEVAKEYAG